MNQGNILIKKHIILGSDEGRERDWDRDAGMERSSKKLKPKGSKGPSKAADNSSAKVLRWQNAWYDFRTVVCKFFSKSQIVNVCLFSTVPL